MRQQQSKNTSRSGKRGNSGRQDRKSERNQENFFDEERGNWKKSENNYRWQQPYGETEYGSEEESNRPYKRNIKTSAPGSQTGLRARSRRKYKSTARPGRASQSAARSQKASRSVLKGRRKRSAPRGFAAMPKSLVRRIAAMGGKASHGGGRPPGSKTRRKSGNR